MGPPPTQKGRFGARWWWGGQAKWPAGQVLWPPLTRPSPPRVDTWQPRLGPTHLKPWPVGRPLDRQGLGSGPLGPHVQYTPVVMMILTFGQLHFVIP
jgi:hypothetical protein